MATAQGVYLLQEFHNAFASVRNQLSNGILRPVIPLTQVTLLGTDGVQILKKHLEEAAKAHFTLIVDASNNSVTLTPTGPMSSAQSNVSLSPPSGSKKKPTAKVSRPPNSFIIYRKEWHPKIVQENPNMHNNDISVIIGSKWKAESDLVKAEYKKKSEDLKRQHAVDNPGYQYQPRKPSEKKKRMTKNKLAKIAANSQMSSGRNAAPQQNLPTDFDPFALLDESLAITAANNPMDVSTYGNLWESNTPTLRTGTSGLLEFNTGDDADMIFAKELAEWNANHQSLGTTIDPATGLQVPVPPSMSACIGQPIVDGQNAMNWARQTIPPQDLPGVQIAAAQNPVPSDASIDAIFKGFDDLPTEINTFDLATIEVDRTFNLEDDYNAFFDYDAAGAED